MNKDRERGDYGGGTITPRGSDSYQLRWYADGKRYTRTVHGSERDAKKEMRRIMTEVDAGAFKTKILTVGKLTEMWLESRDGAVTDRTFSEYKSKCKYHILPGFGEYDVEELNLGIIQAWINKSKKCGSVIKNRPLSPQSIKHCITILHSIMQYGVDNDKIDRNPVNQRKLVMPRIHKVGYPDLSKEEIKKVLDAFKGHPLEMAVWIGCFTGMRRGEILALTWDDILFDKGLIMVRNSVSEVDKRVFLKETKTYGSEASVPMVSILAKKLQECKVTSKNYLVTYNPKTGGIFRPNRFSDLFIDRVDAVLGRHMRLHDLRHQLAQVLNGLGISLKTISEILRHSSISVSANMYMHKDLDTERKALDAFEEYINE